MHNDPDGTLINRFVDFSSFFVIPALCPIGTERPFGQVPVVRAVRPRSAENREFPRDGTHRLEGERALGEGRGVERRENSLGGQDKDGERSETVVAIALGTGIDAALVGSRTGAETPVRKAEAGVGEGVEMDLEKNGRIMAPVLLIQPGQILPWVLLQFLPHLHLDIASPIPNGLLLSDHVGS